jgi:RND family efflux transporter MFP subunit
MLHQREAAPVARAGDKAPGRGSGPASAATGRRLQIFAVLVAIVLAIGFVVVNHSRNSDADQLADATRKQAALPPPVVVIAAQPTPSNASLTLPGNTAAWYASTIYARVDGYVGKWFVDIGDHVKKSQVLATIETPDLDAELTAAQAKLKSAQADVSVRQAQAGFAKTTYQRWRDSPKGVVSEQERDAKKADFGSAAAQLNAALANVTADQGAVDRLMALTRFKEVTAPYDGVITQRHIDIGNLVTAGSNASTTPLYRMSSNDPIRVFVDAPQRVAADMVLGTGATMTADDLPDHPFHGIVTRTANAIDPASRTLRVEVDVPNPNRLLVPGMYVQVAFELKSRGAVQVPASAMIYRTAGPQIATVGADNRVHFHDVIIARDDGNVVEIGSGIKPGDSVVLNISNEIADDAKVAVAGRAPGLASATR